MFWLLAAQTMKWLQILTHCRGPLIFGALSTLADRKFAQFGEHFSRAPQHVIAVVHGWNAPNILPLNLRKIIKFNSFLCNCKMNSCVDWTCNFSHSESSLLTIMGFSAERTENVQFKMKWNALEQRTFYRFRDGLSLLSAAKRVVKTMEWERMIIAPKCNQHVILIIISLCTMLSIKDNSRFSCHDKNFANFNSVGGSIFIVAY